MTDLEKFVKAIAKIGSSDVKIDAGKIKTIGDALLPLGKGIAGFANVDMEKIVGARTGRDSELEIFFDILASEKMVAVANANLDGVAKGITPLGKAMDTFSGLDMASIVGNNWTPGKETSFESFIGALGMATEKIKNPKHLQEVAIGIKALGEGMQTFKGIDATAINVAMKSATSGELTKTAKGIEKQDMVSQDVSSTKGKKKSAVMASQTSQPKDLTMHKGEKGTWAEVGNEWIFYSDRSAATGGLITPKTAGIFELHQGEMVMDNAAVAAFQKSLNLVNKSQENALAGVGGAAPIIVNNNNVDNSMKSTQTTAVSIPEPTRTNESTVRALQMN